MRRCVLFKSLVFLLFIFIFSASAIASSSSFQFCFACSASTVHSTIVISPTCVSEGKTVYKCTFCGSEKITPISRLNHSFEISSAPASCVSNGYCITSCSMCGVVSASEDIPALGHSYSFETVSNPTCVSDGLIRYFCNRAGCYHFYDSVVLASGHLMSGITVDASCTVDGSRVSNCSRCDYTETEVLPALGHALSLSVVDATCVSDGSKMSACFRCDYTAAETIPMLGHVWQETSRLDPTYTSEGEIVHTCIRCLEILTECIPALDAASCIHTWVEIHRVDSTFSDPGTVEYECSSCRSVITESLSVLDASYCIHQFEEESRVDASYEADGVLTFRCSLCGTGKATRLPILISDSEDNSFFTELSISFSSIFGVYEPLLTTHVTTTSSTSEIIQVLTTGVAEGAAGVDYEYLAGVFLFSILLYCVLRLFGGVLKQWRT